VVLIAVPTAELVVGYIHFQRSWERGSALRWLAGRIDERLRPQVRALPAPAAPSAAALRTYANRFGALTETVAGLGSTLMVVYVPQYPPTSVTGRTFFRALCAEHQVRFIDLSTVFQDYPADWLYQLPSDTHLSPLGHRLVAAALLQALHEAGMEQSTNRPPSPVATPVARGPHPSGVDEIRVWAGLPYRVVTNSSGFRMSREVDFQRERLILVLGDSFTFGTTVGNEFAYPTIVDRSLDRIAVLNAGVPGAGIEQEYAALLDMAETRVPALVVLQVLDNDLSGPDTR
jgi:lysophospholipase L1-like esterase